MDEHKFLGQTLYRRVMFVVLTVVIPVCSALAKHPYDYFKDFCSIGERAPGGFGHIQARDFIIQSIENPEVDSFSMLSVYYYNIYKRYEGREPRIGFAAHWDSDIGCPGANDGGSGVAVLLSLADTLARHQPSQAVDLLFFDGEDVEKAELLGSQHFAASCVDNYGFIIVLDMVADRDLQIFQEGNSAKFFPDFVDSIWQVGMAIAPGVFVPAVKYYIIDDHMSLIKYGIRSIVVIDFDYAYWDTKDDTFDKCSRESLDAVYRFVLQLVYHRSGY